MPQGIRIQMRANEFHGWKNKEVSPWVKTLRDLPHVTCIDSLNIANKNTQRMNAGNMNPCTQEKQKKFK